ncbi:16S rRNA processing protein RimM [Paroceanicella profunda]|uniref:Ribosome maturation factor RimM n=1 Tax=Paroceanicella profunda TaxID=2579971 RepID=A0A5B8FGE0_9RHOB|nr:ribosome maturation factor RimM [Paroceanicella profunda]QDL90977.1 16S rRNA processing protein RimM [Paroceanicella profunda]
MSGPDRDSMICVGAIAGAFGVRGEVRVKSFCSEPEDIAGYAPLSTEDGAHSYTLKITRAVKGGLACWLGGVKTREQAEALRGVRLFAPRDRLPALPDDEFYHADLIGLDVLDTGGARLGRLHAIHDHGAGDFLEITGPGLKTPLLIPFTLEAVPTVDLAARRIIVDPPVEVLGEGRGGEEDDTE